jgi:hypothetical protein
VMTEKFIQLQHIQEMIFMMDHSEWNPEWTVKVSLHCQ